MVSGKILGISTSLVILVIAIAVVIRFGSNLKIGERFNEGLQDFSGGINSFFDSLLPSAAAQESSPPLELTQPGEGINPADNPTNPTPVDIIVNDPTKTPTEIRDELIDRIPDSQKEGTQGFERTFRQDGSEEFNPSSTSFFGFSNINDGKGLDINSNAARELNDFLAGGGNIADVSVGASGILQKNQSEPFGPILPSAFAEEIPQVQGPIQVPSGKELESRLSLDLFAQAQKSQDLTNLKSGNVKGEVEGVKIREARGGNFIIRPTTPDRTRLLTDSNNKPIETASQRANRVFIESGRFADERRGATSFKKSRNKNRNFGTNTGSGLRINDRPSRTAGSREDLLAREAQKARQIFDGSKISNF